MFDFRARMPNLKQTFRSMLIPKFRVYSGGQFVSLAGTWMQNVALSWVVYKMTGSPLALGMVQFASNLPLLLLMFFGGLVADRFDKRKILIVTQWLDLAQATLLSVLVITGHITVPVLIGLAVFLGCVTAFETPCRQAFISGLVPKEDMASAIGINSAIVNVSRLIGPTLAGLLMSSGGEAACFIANALSYLAALWALKKIGAMEHPVAGDDAETKDEHATDQAELDAAAATTVGAWMLQPHIRNVVLLVAATSIFGFQYSLLLPVIAQQNLGDSTGAVLAALSAAMGLGALFGSLTIATKGTVIWLQRKIGFAALLLGFSVGLLAFSHVLWLSMIAMAGCGLAVGVQLGGSNSLLQLQVPSPLRGRVMSIFSTIMMGMGPFNALLGGFSAEHLGLRIALSIVAVAMIAASIAYLRLTKFQTSGEKNGQA